MYFKEEELEPEIEALIEKREEARRGKRLGFGRSDSRTAFGSWYSGYRCTTSPHLAQKVVD
jgi:hypothetical protein